MKATQSLPRRYALILDQSEIRKLLRKVEALDLPRRECHPLDCYNGRKVSSELARFDAAVDRGLIEDNAPVIKPLVAPPRSRALVESDDDLDDEWDA